ncbi:MAG TPA: phosphotransferase [Methylomirabilota bacterium]|nr:phosphotransferase [Methylomirabilota bacterium]
MSDQFVGTMPVQERHRFDVARLEAYLREHVEDFKGPLEVEQFRGGQSNPTYLLTTPGARYVLRRKPPGKLLPSAHAVDREYRVMTAVAKAGIPVARTYCLCQDDTVVGTAFYVMAYVEGRVLWDQALPGMSKAERAATYDELGRVIAALHMVDYAAIGLGEFGKPGNYFARQIGRWTSQYRASETEPIPAMDRLIDWLPRSIPPGDEITIVHGDYRLDNVIFHPTELRILAVLDWELSTLGHPLADFSYHCLSWHIPPGHFRGIGGLDLEALGIPTEAEYVRAYCRRTGRARIEHWDFYLAYGLFRIAAILQGIRKRAEDGTAASEHAFDAGERAKPLAEMGWKYARRAGAA